MTSQFVLFGSQHLISIASIFLISVLFPLVIKGLNIKSVTKTVLLILGITLIAHELIKPFYRVIYYDHSIYEVFPIHICHLAALSMGIYILTKVKFFFEVAYFFGLTGNLLAMVTPDLDYSYPDPEFITYYFGHGLLFLTVFYVCICTDVKLTWWSVFRVLLFAVCLLPAIYSLNMYLVGYYSDVNYWYLMITPAANTLLDFFPAPPWHIPYLALITVILFTAIYLPFKYLNSYKQTSF